MQVLKPEETLTPILMRIQNWAALTPHATLPEVTDLRNHIFGDLIREFDVARVVARNARVVTRVR